MHLYSTACIYIPTHPHAAPLASCACIPLKEDANAAPRAIFVALADRPARDDTQQILRQRVVDGHEQWVRAFRFATAQIVGMRHRFNVYAVILASHLSGRLRNGLGAYHRAERIACAA